jgi:predicted O-linked N-acetylglucosamine transferase (SPINDLY family)
MGRIDIVRRLPIGEYFLAYREVDIALDTFPYNGATTTCDALLMGVPVVAVAGKRAIARGGVSLLSCVGLQDWIASSPEAVTDVVLAHIGDPDKMADLRLRLPERMRTSPLMDCAAFARDVESVFERAWCDSEPRAN